MEMRVQIIDDKQLKNCSICKATDEWVENICVNGIEGLYCVKCDSFVIDTAKINLLLQSLISSAQYNYIEEFVNIYSSLEQILNFDDTWQIRK